MTSAKCFSRISHHSSHFVMTVSPEIKIAKVDKLVTQITNKNRKHI